MRPFDWALAQRRVGHRLDKLGQDGSIRRTVAGEGGEPWNPASQTRARRVDHPCRLIVDEYTESERVGTLIEASDKRVFIKAFGLDDIRPSAGDQVVIDHQAHAIVQVTTHGPIETPTHYEAQVRF